MVKENIKASLNDRQIAITLVTAYMNFFGPSSPLGQKRLRQYLHKTRCEILYYIGGASFVTLYFSETHCFLNIAFLFFFNYKGQFSETYLSFNFTYIIYHGSFMKIMTFMTSFRFFITPPGNSFHY